MTLLELAHKHPNLVLHLVYWPAERLWRAKAGYGGRIEADQLAAVVGRTPMLALDALADDLGGRVIDGETVPELEVME